eukprot:4179315-Amphidinium_carterae.1
MAGACRCQACHHQAINRARCKAYLRGHQLIPEGDRHSHGKGRGRFFQRLWSCTWHPKVI